MTNQHILTPIAVPRHAKRRRAIVTIRDKKRTVCPVTGKTRYRDRRTARQALDSCRWQRTTEIAESGVTSRSEARIYVCPELVCHGGLHLTSIRVWHAA